MVLAISSTTSNKMSRTNGDGGSWSTGFLCPSFLIDGVDQGEVRIYANDIATANSATTENKYSFVLDFTAPPKALLKSVTTLVSGNKYRLPFRRLLNNSRYVNPFGGYKYIMGVLQDETGKQYAFKLNLPYKTFGWWITDDEGNKITAALNKNATDRTSSVISYKYTLRKNYVNYQDANKFYKSLSTSQAEYDALLKQRESEVNNLQTSLITLRTTASAADAAFNNAKNELLEVEKQLNELFNKESLINSEINSINESAKVLSEQGEDFAKQKEVLNSKITSVKAVLDAEFAKLKENAPQKGAEIDASKLALYALDKTNFQTNLNAVYP
jgi:hypothetical protein